MAYPRTRSCNDALQEGCYEGTHNRIGKDWGGVHSASDCYPPDDPMAQPSDNPPYRVDRAY